jgi:hypothetical protein
VSPRVIRGFAWFAAIICGAQTPPSTETLVLSRIREKIASRLANLPSYTCLETTERAERADHSPSFIFSDILQLEVAEIGGKELFAKPGARFEDIHPSTVATAGTTSTGEFALYLRTIFLHQGTVFEYAGDTESNGRRIIKYGYDIPSGISGYTVMHGALSAKVPYHGSFWVEPNSWDLVRLDAVVDRIPPKLPIRRVSTRIDYRRFQIGDSSFLLPQSSELVAAQSTGFERRNRTEFTHCRQYTGNSRISFGDEIETPSETDLTLELPAGLRLFLELQTPVHFKTAQVGDRIEARVTEDASQKRQVIVARGAQVTGRLRRLDHDIEHGGRFIVALEFTEIESAGRRLPFIARLEHLKTSLPMKVLRQRDLSLPAQTYTPESPDIPAAPGVGILLAKDATTILPKGLIMTWKSLEYR